ncbi:MAG: hypothetical protein ACK4S8_14600 [Alishewanella aestuarii]
MAIAVAFDIMASMFTGALGGFAARKAVTKLGAKLTEKGFSSAGKTLAKSSKVQTTADVLGGAGALTAYEQLKGSEKDPVEQFIENTALGFVGVGAFNVLKGASRGVAKIAPESVKTALSNAKEKIYQFAFTPGVTKEARDKIASFFNLPSANMETIEPYLWKIRTEIIDTDTFKSLKTILTKKLLESVEKDPKSYEIVKKWIDLQERRPDVLNVMNLVTLEYTLYHGLSHSLIEKFTEITKSMPFYKEAFESFVSNLKKILIHTSLYNPEESVDDLLKAILMRNPETMERIEHLFIRYFPRAHIRLPHPTEKTTDDVLTLLVDGELYNPEFTAGLMQYFKRRDFPTLYDKLRTFILSSPPQALENNLKYVDFRKGSDLYRVMIGKFNTPMILDKLPNLLEDLGKIKYEGKPYAVLGSKLHDYFSYAKAPINIYDKAGIRQTYYLHNNIDSPLKTAIEYHLGFLPDIDVGGALGTIYKINAFLKKLKLSISPFHAANLMKNYVSATGEGASKYMKDIIEYNLTRTNYQLINRTLDDFAYIKDVEELAKFMKYLASKHPDVPIEFTLASNINAFENYRKHVLEPYLKHAAFKGKDIDKDAWRYFLEFVGKIQTPAEFFTFDVVYKAVKLATAKQVMNLFKSGVIDEYEAIQALNHINAIYGGAAIWKYVDPARQALIRLLLFAPDWYLSLWRNFSTWLKGDSFLVASFYPTLARLHLWGVINAHEIMGIDYFDRIDKILTHYVDNVQIEDIPKIPFALLHLMREWYKIPIPIYNKDGIRKVVYINLPGIELEPLEMIGLFSLSRSIAEGQPLWKIPLSGMGESFQYWTGKLSSILKVLVDISNYYIIGREKEEDEYAVNVLMKLGEHIIPLSIIYAFSKGDDIWASKQQLDLVRAGYFLKNFSFGIETVKAGQALANAIAINDVVTIDFIINKFIQYERVMGRRNFMDNLMESTASALLKRFGGKTEETIEKIEAMLENLTLSVDEGMDAYLKAKLRRNLRKSVRKAQKVEKRKKERRAIIREIDEEEE